MIGTSRRRWPRHIWLSTVAGVRLDVLGPMRAWGDDGPLCIPHGRASRVLSYLALHVNDSVEPSNIGRALWPDEPSDKARMQVRAAARHLAKALGPGLLNGRAGLTLRVAATSIDAYRFEEIVDQARSSLGSGETAAAKSLLLDGLSLWRGEAFGELAEVAEAAPEIERLSAGRADALEDLYGIELRAGSSYALVARLRSDVVKRPRRPRLRRQLALALYLTGRQSEALAVARESTAALGGPDRLMANLESAILRHDQDLERGEPPTGRP